MQDDTFSFIVRIWSETTDPTGQRLTWRGSIEQVGDRQRLYFQDLDNVCRFIQTQAGLGSRQSPTDLSTALDLDTP